MVLGGGGSRQRLHLGVGRCVIPALVLARTRVEEVPPPAHHDSSSQPRLWISGRTSEWPHLEALDRRGTRQVGWQALRHDAIATSGETACRSKVRCVSRCTIVHMGIDIGPSWVGIAMMLLGLHFGRYLSKVVSPTNLGTTLAASFDRARPNLGATSAEIHSMSTHT